MESANDDHAVLTAYPAREITMTTDAMLDVGAAGRPRSGTTARYLPTAARIVLGLVFFIVGLNGFFFFLPQPKTLPQGAVAWMTAMVATGYLFPLVMGTQLICGVLLLANRFVPLALAVLAPILVNIIAYHIFLQPAGLVMAVPVLLLELYLVWTYRRVYRPMLAARV